MRLPRVYPILDTESLDRRAIALETAAAAFLEGGAGILQIRHKRHWSRGFFETARTVARLCREAGAPLVVNDRADFAMLLEAGLHVGQDDLSPESARKIVGPKRWLGVSTHNPPQVTEADQSSANYLAIGPVFGTGSKQKPDPVVGLDGVREARRLTSKPLVAIGGITRANCLSVLAAGADSVAVISDLVKQPGPSAKEFLRLLS